MPRKPDNDGNYIRPTTLHYNIRCVGGVIFNSVGTLLQESSIGGHRVGILRYGAAGIDEEGNREVVFGKVRGAIWPQTHPASRRLLELFDIGISRELYSLPAI